VRRHLRPLGVSQYKSLHPELESDFARAANPKSQQALEQIAAGRERPYA
jgi:hypothetical protein